MNTRTRSMVVAMATAIALLVTLAHARVAVAQTVQTKRVMQQKLTESQQLLAAVVTSNWTALDRHTRALDALTRQPGWEVMRLPEFSKQTMAFQQALAMLVRAAGQRDQRTAVSAYTGLVSSCVECHSYVARSRIAAGR